MKDDSSWLNDQLKQKIRKVFEPRYKRKLTDLEVENIAVNLTEVMEELLKLRWRQKYAKNL